MHVVRDMLHRAVNGGLWLLAWPLGRTMAKVETGLWDGDMAAPETRQGSHGPR